MGKLVSLCVCVFASEHGYEVQFIISFSLQQDAQNHKRFSRLSLILMCLFQCMSIHMSTSKQNLQATKVIVFYTYRNSFVPTLHSLTHHTPPNIAFYHPLAKEIAKVMQCVQHQQQQQQQKKSILDGKIYSLHGSLNYSI